MIMMEICLILISERHIHAEEQQQKSSKTFAFARSKLVHLMDFNEFETSNQFVRNHRNESLNRSRFSRRDQISVFGQEDLNSIRVVIKFYTCSNRDFEPK